MNPEKHSGLRITLASLVIGVIGGYLVRDCQTNSPPPPAKTLLLEPSREFLSVKEKQLEEILVNSWLEIKSNYDVIIWRPLNFGEENISSFPFTEEIVKMSRQHLIDGLALAQLILPLGETPRIETKERKVNFKNRVFEIDNSLHFQVLAGVLEQEFKDYLSQRGKQTIWAYEQQEKEKTLSDLFWLLEEGLPISIDSEAFPFLTTKNLILISRLFQALQKANLPFPREISYSKPKPHSNLAGGYFDHAQPPEFRFTIFITNRAGFGAPVHEIGHFLSDATYLNPQDLRLAKINQSKYEEQIIVAAGGVENLKQYRNFLAKDEKGEINLSEDYASTLEAYFIEGAEFREELHYWEETDPSVYRILVAKYEFMKKVLAGLESRSDGEILAKD